MTKNFNDILDGSVKFGDSQRVCFEKGFEAGQQSRQAEVDELQKRIDEAIAILSSKKKMYVDMVIEVEKALKGGNK